MSNTINLARQIDAYLDCGGGIALELELGRLALTHLGLHELLQRLSPDELKALAQEVPLSPQMPAMIRSSLYTLSLERRTEAPSTSHLTPVSYQPMRHD